MTTLELVVAGMIASVLTITGIASVNFQPVDANTSYVAAVSSAQNIETSAAIEYLTPGNTTTWSSDVAAATAAVGDPAVTYDPATQLLTFSAVACWTVDMTTPAATPYVATACP